MIFVWINSHWPLRSNPLPTSPFSGHGIQSQYTYTYKEHFLTQLSLPLRLVFELKYEFPCLKRYDYILFIIRSLKVNKLHVFLSFLIFYIRPISIFVVFPVSGRISFCRPGRSEKINRWCKYFTSSTILTKWRTYEKCRLGLKGFRAWFTDQKFIGAFEMKKSRGTYGVN